MKISFRERCQTHGGYDCGCIVDTVDRVRSPRVKVDRLGDPPVAPPTPYELQHGRCKLCMNPVGEDELVADYCKQTGKLRGLLCYSCDQLLSHCTVGLLQRTIRYIEKNGEV
jgi:hypothetical protein